MSQAKQKWIVATDLGTRPTWAVSRGRAIRNVRYRLVMDKRSYERPRPQDFAEMREIEILGVELAVGAGRIGGGR